MKATDLTRGDWIKRGDHEFQVRKVEDGEVCIGNSGQSYSVDRVDQLLEQDDVEVEEDVGLENRVGTGWA